jgi:hypothetical protein
MRQVDCLTYDSVLSLRWIEVGLVYSRDLKCYTVGPSMLF